MDTSLKGRRALHDYTSRSDELEEALEELNNSINVQPVESILKETVCCLCGFKIHVHTACRRHALPTESTPLWSV